MPEGNHVELAERQLKELKDLSVLKEAAREFESRIPRLKTLPVIDYKPKNPDDEDVLVPPGSVTLFLTRARSRMLTRVRKAVESTTGEDLKLMRELKGIYRQRKMVPLETAVEILKKQPVIANLQYANSTVARNLFLPDDLELCMVPLPYNGGKLTRNGFQLVQASHPRIKGELDGFLVRHMPRLTPAEKEAIRLIPEDMIGSNIGDAAMCYAITAVGVVMVVIFATAACPGKYGDLHLDDLTIRKLGPAATARQLLSLRRNILEQKRVG